MTKVTMLLMSSVLTFGAVAPIDMAFAKKKPVSVARPGSTDINDCGKLQLFAHDNCISRSRAVKGASLYAKMVPTAAPAAKKAAVMASGPTSLSACGKLKGMARDACISNSSAVRVSK